MTIRNMGELDIWNVTTGQPQRFRRGLLNVEKSLADWIEREPSLVQEEMVMVGRQVETIAGTIDLLGIDRAGRWIVVAIKIGGIRKETITQAKNCASRIGEMDEDELLTSMDAYLKPHQTDTQHLLAAHQINDQIVFEKREVIIYVIGIGDDQPVDLAATALTFRDNPIRVLHFDLFENDAREQIIVRTGAQPEISSPAPPVQAKKVPPPLKHWPLTPAIERLFRIAAENGIGDDFRLLHETAIRHGLYPRTYRWSIMYAPPQNKTRCLICAWAKREKSHEVVVYIAAEAFAEFYPIPEQAVEDSLGGNHWKRIPQGQMAAFAAGLDTLFEKISNN